VQAKHNPLKWTYLSGGTVQSTNLMETDLVVAAICAIAKDAQCKPKHVVLYDADQQPLWPARADPPTEEEAEPSGGGAHLVYGTSLMDLCGGVRALFSRGLSVVILK
jgi:hypothetical protein